jgi:NAD+ kinase
MMRYKIHFMFESDKPEIAAFSRELISGFTQFRLDEADIIVSVGGDGMLLQAFRCAHNGQSVLGVLPPLSNSRGFWTNHGIDSVEQLERVLGSARGYIVNPLAIYAHYRGGKVDVLRAFNEAMPSENSGQAMLVELTVSSGGIGGSVIGPLRVMGDGLIIATALGSTAINRTYGGSSIDIRNSGIAVAGKGIYEPKDGFKPIVAADDTQFDIRILSAEKRPVRLQYDGLCIAPQEDDPFEQIIIEKDHAHSVKLLLMDDPSHRAFATLKPA